MPTKKKWPAPSRKAHNTFCLNEGWEPVRGPQATDVDHHITYELPLPDDRVLRTRVSRPPNKETYGPGMWQHILRDQLQVSEDTFWACVQDKVKPNRGQPAVPPDAIPADLVYLLKSRLRLSDTEIRAMSRVEAIERLTRHWQGSP